MSLPYMIDLRNLTLPEALACVGNYFHMQFAERVQADKTEAIHRLAEDAGAPVVDAPPLPYDVRTTQYPQTLQDRMPDRNPEWLLKAAAQDYALSKHGWKITRAEMEELFGPTMPIEAAILLNPDTNPAQMTLLEVRKQLYTLALAAKKATSEPDIKPDTDEADHWAHATPEEVLKGIYDWWVRYESGDTMPHLLFERLGVLADRIGEQD